MCLAKIFLNTDQDNPTLRDIARLNVSSGQVEMETLAGESKVIRGRVTEIDFLSSTVILNVNSNETD